MAMLAAMLKSDERMSAVVFGFGLLGGPPPARLSTGSV
jgi:hypothetical protein